MTSYIIPVLTLAVLCTGLFKRVDIFSEFVRGAEEGLRTSAEIIPPLIFLLTAVGMLKASGTVEKLSELLTPVTDHLGFPPECLTLVLIRPFSGSGAAAVFETLLRENHPDSFAGRTASVLLGSTETTFYTITLYYSAAGIKKGRHTLAASAVGDIAGFIFSALTVRIFIGK